MKTPAQWRDLLQAQPPDCDEAWVRFIGAVQQDALACAPPAMTLRDWFAGQAVVGLLAQSANKPWPLDSLVSAAYELADSMIVYRPSPLKP